MTQEQMRWQEDGRRAFDWIAKVYAQTRAVWDDAQSTFAEDGWTVRSGSGWGARRWGSHWINGRSHTSRRSV